MSAVALILSEIERRGVVVRVDGENLRLSPRRALDTHLLKTIFDHKREIIREIARGTQKDRCGIPACGSAQCAGCYEVAPNMRIHPPKCGEDYRVWLERWEAKGKVQ